MSYDIYRDRILVHRQSYVIGDDRMVLIWARLRPGWVSIVPTLLPNNHRIAVWEDDLYERSPEHRRRSDLLQTHPKALMIGSFAEEVTMTDYCRIRYGCVATLNPRIYGHCLVDDPNMDFGYLVSDLISDHHDDMETSPS